MTPQQQTSKAWHISLWIAQVLLALSLLWAAWMKLLQPTGDLAAMWPWAGEVPDSLIKLTGFVDLLGGFGLILPTLLRILPRLTILAAWGVVLLMIVAGTFHVVRGEASQIGANIVFGLMAVFIAWGRSRKAPISQRNAD